MPTNIEPAKKFDAVPLIEVGDEVKGGLEGAANKQAIALANRTQYLKEELEQIPPRSMRRSVSSRGHRIHSRSTCHKTRQTTST